MYLLKESNSLIQPYKQVSRTQFEFETSTGKVYEVEFYPSTKTLKNIILDYTKNRQEFNVESKDKLFHYEMSFKLVGDKGLQTQNFSDKTVFEVFATIQNIVYKVIMHKNPDAISFSTANSKLISIYNRFGKKIKELGYTEYNFLSDSKEKVYLFLRKL